MFAVSPPSVDFKDIQRSTSYVQKFNVKNTSAVPCSIRLTSPHIAQFQLRYVPGRPVAPGLTVSAEVIFSCEEEKDYFDEILVLTDSPAAADTGPVRIPLCASVTCLTTRAT